MLTPYQFASNRPIDGIDLDGLEWDDSKISFKVNKETTRIAIEGELNIKVKIINLTQKTISEEAQEFHRNKSSSTFDIKSYTSSYIYLIRKFDTGELFKNGQAKQVIAETDNLNINFTFENISSENSIKKGDFVLLLVNDIPDNEYETAGVSIPYGNVYAIEIDEFNKKTHIDTHEKGHVLAGLDDRETKDKGAKNGYLMSYIGDGFKLYRSDITDILESIINERVLQKIDWGRDNVDTKKTSE